MVAPKPTTTAAPKAATASADAGQAEMQAQADKEQEQGFVGTEVDPTPNENYTLAGVTSGAPTPETDDATKAAADANAAKVQAKFDAGNKNAG
jgi:hypothetical protein